MIIYNSSTIVITYDRDRSIIKQKWTGFTPSRIFMEAIDATFEFMKNYEIYKIISDIKEQKVVAPREQEYVKNLSHQFLREKGNFKIAFIAEPRSLAEVCVKRYAMSLKAEVSLEINRFFEDADSAMSWLESEENRTNRE